MEKKLLVIIILVVIASLSIAGCTTSKNEQTVQSSSNTPTSSQNTPTVSVTATYLGSENSLTSSYGTPTAAASGYKFVKYAVYFENINAKDMQMGNALFFTLRDTEGNIYSYDSFMFSVQQRVDGVILTGVTPQMNTQPGDKYSGLIIFQIPTSATPKSLTYDDYTNRITINLAWQVPSNGQLKWYYTAGGWVESSPAVANGIVYVGSNDNNVYALNATTGAKVWSYTTGDAVSSSPAVVTGVVYVGSLDRNVYALNATTGAKVWSYTTGGPVSSPAVSNGVVYVGSDDHNVYALNATTGAKVWSFTTGYYVDSSPAVFKRGGLRGER